MCPASLPMGMLMCDELPGTRMEGLMILQGQCDGAEQAPESSTALLPNQCVLTMSGQARYFIATDGPGHQLFIQNIMILRAHEAGEPRAAISLYQGQIAVYDTTVESRQHAAAPAMVMDSASAFIARTFLLLSLSGWTWTPAH